MATRPAKAINIAVLGAGTVGSQVIRLIQERREDLQRRSGLLWNLTAVLVRDLDAERDYDVPASLLTTDIDEALASADVVVELIGGIEPALDYVKRALKAGACVVTGNKALLAKHGPELFALAAANQVELQYEAAVAGAVPIVRALREGVAGDRVNRVLGIVNGTTNFILDRMSTTGAAYDEALAQAQALGYAEADPTADVDGLDAAAKCALMASLAFGCRVLIDDVYTEGIRAITPVQITRAREANMVIKLLAVAERRTTTTGEEGIDVRVHPALLPAGHPLASVSGAFNAIMLECEAAGELMFFGQGAGGVPTASAVLSDLVATAARHGHGQHPPSESHYEQFPVLPPQSTRVCYQVSLLINAADVSLSDVVGEFAQHGISIQCASQKQVSIQCASQNQVINAQPANPDLENTQVQSAERASVVLITNPTPESDLREALDALRSSPTGVQVESVIRVEGVA
ncbi:homoserine dehydrogenase [Gleimia hominis]|uniref:homoserine dehydrogenase n=1 Tax=Gleimia hominis TaxID=595468 RepID=UPI000C80434E|nr:homoserine dehydrogenase [Gleimia hominis]WIK64818.1 homoserine dehydrogenase [Gleimia hominis]